MTVAIEKPKEKYIHEEPQQMTDERGRKWFMQLGTLTHVDIDDADRGLLNLSGTFDFGGTGQGIQCILDSPFKDEKDHFVKRLGTVFGCELIRQLINTLGVSSLFDMNNRLWYALYDRKPGLGGGYILGIAHPTDKSKYIIFKDVIDEVKGLDWTKDQKDDD